jgi:Protein of unknown function (DUF3485)
MPIQAGRLADMPRSMEAISNYQSAKTSIARICLLLIGEPEMNSRLSWRCFLAVFGTLLLTGWMHGLRSGRWQPEEALTEAVARVDAVPLTVGEWSAEAEPVDDDEFYQAGAMSYWVRRYTHARTRESVLVILMCGRPGRMSVHTPEICYQGAGFSLAASPATFTVTWQEIASECRATFWTARFRKEGPSLPAPLRLLWGWNSRGRWQAPSNPRWETKGEPFLYKIYVALDGAGPGLRRSHEETPPDLRQAQEFLQEFLPQLQESLFHK